VEQAEREPVWPPDEIEASPREWGRDQEGWPSRPAEPAAAETAQPAEAEQPEEAAAPADVSAGWAAPADTPTEEARTVPDVSGPAEPSEQVEDQIDFVPEPEGEGSTPDLVVREGVTGNEAGQVRAPAGENESDDAPDARDVEALRPEEATRSE